MSALYNEYLIEHKSNVLKGFDWLSKNLPYIFLNDQIKSRCEWLCANAHDQSKYNKEEYDAYDKYFYGGNRSYQVVQDFNYAWLHHIHNNPHHWQHWVLINDDPEEGEILMDMPYNYIIEMICDWWAFSWSKGNLGEIFTWYEEHKNYMKLSPKTRKTVEDILDKISDKFEEKANEFEVESED